MMNKKPVYIYSVSLIVLSLLFIPKTADAGIIDFFKYLFSGDDQEEVTSEEISIALGSISNTCQTTPLTSGDYAAKTVCTYTGNDQVVQVPPQANAVMVKAWGAAGGGTPRSRGGAGGYASGILAVQPGQDLVVVVGEGGIRGDENPTYGGGGPGYTHPQFGLGGAGDGSSGSGGGLSGIFTRSFSIASQSDALLVAGAGGGGSGGLSYDNGGAGGGTAGTNGFDGNYAGTQLEHRGKGATQSGPGAGGVYGDPVIDGEVGSALAGGIGGRAYDAGNVIGGFGGGGGGAGYFGGGGGIGGHGNSIFGDAGGGGGSGFCASIVANCDLKTGEAGGQNGNPVAPPNTDDVDYVSNVGTAKMTENGGNGLVVLYWTTANAPQVESDVCSNIEGIQTRTPSGFNASGTVCMPSASACSAIQGFTTSCVNQTTTNSNYEWSALVNGGVGDIQYTWERGGNRETTSEAFSNYGTYTNQITTRDEAGNVNVRVCNVNYQECFTNSDCGNGFSCSANRCTNQPATTESTIVSFESDSRFASSQDTCTLYWEAVNVTTCRLVNISGDVVRAGLPTSNTVGYQVPLGRHRLECDSPTATAASEYLQCLSNPNVREV